MGESVAMGQSYADALNQALGLGMQGGNILQGQQAIFNPSQYGYMAGQGFNNYTQATPTSGFWGNLGASVLGAALTSTPFGQMKNPFGGGGSYTTTGGGYGSDLYGGWKGF